MYFFLSREKTRFAFFHKTLKTTKKKQFLHIHDFMVINKKNVSNAKHNAEYSFTLSFAVCFAFSNDYVFLSLSLHHLQSSVVISFFFYILPFDDCLFLSFCSFPADKKNKQTKIIKFQKETACSHAKSLPHMARFSKTVRLFIYKFGFDLNNTLKSFTKTKRKRKHRTPDR